MRVLIGVELDPEEIARLRDEFPELDFEEALGQEALSEKIAGFDILFGGHPKADHIASASRLRWIQSYSAGINAFPLSDLKTRSVALTNASGAHAIPIAENILAMMFAFAIRLPDFVRAQQQRLWERRDMASEKFEVHGQTLLIAGLGGIGAGLALKAHALGMRVVGLRNRELPPPDGVDEIVRKENLLGALGRADHVALCLPLTEETTAFMGEVELRGMKPSGYIYNVGRGKSIDRQALLNALSEKWIAGAGLDVTDPEPLPEDDPLWTFPNVILSQHTSGSSRQLDRRVTDIFAANLRRFLNGDELENLVDYDRGY
jgi:phosphoglycerate dehydrogenase-like enzyme